MCRAVLGPFLRSCGFRDAAIQWLPASAPAGENLVSPPVDPRFVAWWRGPCLTAAIDAFAPAGRAAAGFLSSALLVYTVPLSHTLASAHLWDGYHSCQQRLLVVAFASRYLLFLAGLPLRVPISDVFRGQRGGTLTGTLFGGKVEVRIQASLHRGSNP